MHVLTGPVRTRLPRPFPLSLSAGHGAAAEATMRVPCSAILPGPHMPLKTTAGVPEPLLKVAAMLFLADENFLCGGLLTNNSGSFSSPWYPKKYPTNVVCAWDIQVDSRAHVKLTFDVVK